MSNRHLTIIGLLTLSALLATPTLAQDVGPAALTHNVAPVERIPLTAVGPIDLRQVQAEDENRALDGMAPRYAIPHPVKITPATDGTWETLADGSRLWRLRIGAPGALSINLGFTRYDMPKGGRLLLYATDNSYSIRPFTADDVQDHGELWTPVLLTDEIVVEVTLPAKTPDGALALELTSINYGYRGFGELRGGDAGPRSGACNVDVVCPEGDLWGPEIAAVAVISTGGGTFCTGFMVNNTAYDLTPYFMTAEHCGINAGNAASLVTYWNYENSTCRVPGGGPSGGPGDGSLSQFNTGSTFLAANNASDMTLVQLNSDPDPSWNVGYAGWDRTSNDFSGAIAIHHPNTDEKRISFEYDPTTTTSYLGETQPGDGAYIRVTDWDLGTTEPGSSGSPLFSPDHRVIGQLKGGYASCTSQTSDWYGRFSVSWVGGGMAAWLDPGATGAMTVDSISSAGLSVAPAGDVTHIGNVGGPFTDPSVVYTLTNSSPSPVSYSVELTASFGILLNGGTAPVTGTLPASGGTTDVTVSLGAAINGLGAGAYVETINFNDLTNATTRTRVHTVEVGQTLISVDPAAGLQTGGPEGGPFTGSLTYRVTSERPTAVDVRIAADQPWISLNGSPGPLDVTLTGTGDFVDVTVAISAAANSLAVGVYSGAVSFTNLTSGVGSTSRPVDLEVGRVTYTPTDVPQAINDNSTITSTITIVDSYCIGDVDVGLDITHTFIGDLIVELSSPSGVIVRLHDRNGGSADNIVTTYDEQGGTLPDGPGALADLNNTAVQGTWTLTISDNAGIDTGTLNDWSLSIVPAGVACPTTEVIHSFPMDTDPGWSIEGQWAFGTPTGGGGSSGGPDPTSGFTGNFVYGYNLNGDYPDDLSPTQYLTTNAMDCTDVSNTRLVFRRWLGIESATYDNANIQVSNNGSTWTTVWAHSGGSTSDGSWALAGYNISSVADNQPTVYIRWGMGTTDGSVTYCGWNIDDVEIWGVSAAPQPCPNGLGDMDGIDGVNGADIQAFVDCFMGNDPAAPGCDCADVINDGSFQANDITEFVNCLLNGACR